jgi:hypothetical protein
LHVVAAFCQGKNDHGEQNEAVLRPPSYLLCRQSHRCDARCCRWWPPSLIIETTAIQVLWVHPHLCSLFAALDCPNYNNSL